MDQVSLREYREWAATLIESGQPQAALRLARHILQHFPLSLRDHCLLGHALLGLGRTHEAAEQFHRVLAADPENVEARLGLATVYERTGDRQRARDQLQYAFDLFPGDSSLRARLNTLAEALSSPEAAAPVGLSRAALARIYARNGLRAKAIQELRAVLMQQPQRQDVRLALAEALWQEGHLVEAIEESERVLQALPEALKASLIIAAVWSESSQPERAQPYLARARALDPENELACALFGTRSPLPSVNPMLDRLKDEAGILPRAAVSAPASVARQAMDHLVGVSEEKEATPMSEQSPSEEAFEIPDWLRGLGDELLSREEEKGKETSEAAETTATPAEPASEPQLPEWLQALIARAEAGGAGAAAASETTEELPAWLAETPAEETSAAAPSGEPQLPDTEELAWLSEAAQMPEESPPPDTEVELPEWLREIQRGRTPQFAEKAEQEAEGDLTSLPEWLREDAMAARVAPVQTDELPDWLRGEPTAAETAPPTAEETPEWLREDAMAARVAPVQTDELPDWLRGEPTAAETVPPTAEETPEQLREAAEPTVSLEAHPAPPAAESVWLTEESAEVALPAAPAEVPAAAAMPSEEEALLPEWLRELRAAAPEQPEETPTEPEGEAPLPDWLYRLRAGLAEEAPPLGTRELEADLAKLSVIPPAETEETPPTQPEVTPEPTPTAEVAEETLPEVAPEAPVEVAEAAAPMEETAPEAVPTAAVAAEAPVEMMETAPAAEVAVAIPETPSERLAMARKAVVAGQWSQALELYASLVASSELLGSVISDLEEGIRRHPDDYQGYQLVGDAYMKEGRLAEALRAYRMALNKLHQQYAA